ncbi:TolC family protein [Pseudoalteromonas sp. NBT06-2]|uniref:TolC family protein n=1 Tax=Pseudoalteromonas sp. NBT06-2 TaxID=2025950 RepID=UPI00207505BC|nr:TolC family protein [Pseudoalteromonas sp. NBT06-2]
MAVIGGFIISFSVSAQQTITLNDAISFTLKQHPDLKSFAHKLEASRGMLEQASVSSPLTVNIDVEDALGTGAYSGVSGMQTTMSISWLLEGDIIDSKIKVAKQNASVSIFEQEVKALDIAAETAKIFITLLSQKEQLVLAKLTRNQAKKLLKEINLRVGAGKSNIIDELRAKADLSKKELVVEDLLHEIEASKAQLAAQWVGDTDFRVDGTLIGIPTISQVEMAYKRLKSNPRLKVFASQQRIAESEIKLAKANQKPAWTVNAGIKRNETVDDFAFTAGISIPFGGENRNRGQIMSLQAKKSQSMAESDAWFKRISTQLLLLTHKLKHNRHVIDGLSKETIPSLELASGKAKEAYSIGRYRYTDLYAVQQELIATQVELIQAYTNIQLFNIELERLTGSSISM